MIIFNKLIIILFLSISLEIFPQNISSDHNLNNEKFPFDGSTFLSILYNNCNTFYLLNNVITPLASKHPGKKYYKGFETQQKFVLNQSDWNRLKLTLLTRDTYLENISRSCFFVPNIGLELEPVIKNNEVKKVIILISGSCKKIFISNTDNDFTGNDGAFIDLKQSGYQNIIRIFENARDPLYDFKTFNSEDPNRSEDPLMVKNQLLLIELLLENKDYKAIEYLHKSRLFTITDNLVIKRDTLKGLDLVFRKNLSRDDRKILDDLLAKPSIAHIKYFINNKVINTTVAPQQADFIDKLPNVTKMNSDVYLDLIKEVINSSDRLKVKYSIENYLKYEREKNISDTNNQILMRTQFYYFLLNELRK